MDIQVSFNGISGVAISYSEALFRYQKGLPVVWVHRWVEVYPNGVENVLTSANGNVRGVAGGSLRFPQRDEVVSGVWIFLAVEREVVGWWQYHTLTSADYFLVMRETLDGSLTEEQIAEHVDDLWRIARGEAARGDWLAPLYERGLLKKYFGCYYRW